MCSWLSRIRALYADLVYIGCRDIVCRALSCGWFFPFCSTMPVCEAPHYHTVRVSLLPAPDVIEWGHSNSTSPGLLALTSGPHSAAGADNVFSNSLAQYATDRTGPSPILSDAISAVLPKLHSIMAGYVFARVLGSTPCLVPISSTGVETSSAAATPFQDYWQYLRECLAYHDAEFAELDGKYLQREEFVTSWRPIWIERNTPLRRPIRNAIGRVSVTRTWLNSVVLRSVRLQICVQGPLSWKLRSVLYLFLRQN